MRLKRIGHDSGNFGGPAIDSGHASGGELIEVSKPFDFRTAIQVLLERWRLLLILSIVVALAAGAWAFLAPATFLAKSVLQVNQDEVRLAGSDVVVPQDLKSAEALNTIVQNIKNSSVLRRVIINNRLETNPNFLVNKPKKKVSETALVNALRAMTTVKLRPDTRLIDISVLHPDAQLAQKLANSIAQEFILQNLSDRFSTSKAANGLLYEEAQRLKSKLEESEKEIQAYKEATQTVSIEDRQNVLVEKLKELSRKYTEAQTQRLALQADLAQINASRTNPAAVFSLTSVQADPGVLDLQKKIVDQQATIAALKTQYQPTYPKVLQAQEQLRELENVLQLFAERVRSTLQFACDAALAREKNLENALREGQVEALALDKKAVGYSVRLRELQSDRALYDAVLKRLKETDLSKGLGQASIALVEPAMNAVSQKRSAVLITGLSFCLVFFGGLVLLYFLRMVRGSIHTVDDAENSLGIPVWAAIPLLNGRGSKQLPDVVMTKPDSPCAEGFRTLRTSAAVSPVTSEKKITLFTSADPGEGKTFCSVNYALCQAQQGKRTLLIDLDLRRSSVNKKLDLPPDLPGVSNYLVEGIELCSLVRPTAYEGMFVLPAGPRLSNPAEELAKGQLLDLLSEASTRFDCVVVDTAPLNAVSDTLLILPFADIVCLVVRSGKTSHRATRRAMDLMLRAHVEPSGIVLNYLPERAGYGSYYHYGADYKTEPTVKERRALALPWGNGEVRPSIQR